MKIYKTKWYNLIFDSLSTGAQRAQAKNGIFLGFNTKKQAQQYSIENYGKQYTQECVISCKGKDL